MSNEETKVWLHVEVGCAFLEAELNRLAAAGYQVFKLIPLLVRDGEEEEDESEVRNTSSVESLVNVHIIAFHLQRFAALQQSVQHANMVKELQDIGEAARKKAEGST